MSDVSVKKWIIIRSYAARLVHIFEGDTEQLRDELLRLYTDFGVTAFEVYALPKATRYVIDTHITIKELP